MPKAKICDCNKLKILFLKKLIYTVSRLPVYVGDPVKYIYVYIFFICIYMNSKSS